MNNTNNTNNCTAIKIIAANFLCGIAALLIFSTLFAGATILSSAEIVEFWAELCK